MDQNQKTKAGITLHFLCRCNIFQKKHPVGCSHFMWHLSYWLQLGPEVEPDVPGEPELPFLYGLRTLSALLSTFSQVPDMIHSVVALGRMKNYLLYYFFLSFVPFSFLFVIKYIFIHTSTDAQSYLFIYSTFHYSALRNPKQSNGNYGKEASNTSG